MVYEKISIVETARRCGLVLDSRTLQCTIKKANPYFVFINGLFGCVFIRDRENEK